MKKLKNEMKQMEKHIHETPRHNELKVYMTNLGARC